ncbi:hypothetical protein KC330_g2203 [Hortaea werneckii]|nr:hypothetical protein KC330_g2203 [Hortaea werneckii]
MPSQSRRQYRTVEVKPDNITAKATHSPSSPGSPKAVRFAPAFKAEPRAPTVTEAWSFYHFECHARQCRYCYNPWDVHRQGRQLCTLGHSLAQDVAEHVYHQDGVTYSCKKDNHKLVKLEMPADYTQVAQLLSSMDRHIRSAPRKAPIISYDPNYPVTARRPAASYPEESWKERGDMIVEPGHSRRDTERTKSTHKTKRQPTTIVEDDVQPSPAVQEPERKERRGSLYYEDMRRQRKRAYKVEIREPERREREGRRRERYKEEYHL